jgi:nicotinate-nucleotide pyrophosphorylase (carboxylating)
MTTAEDAYGFPGDRWLADLVTRALAEDVGGGDVSTAVAVAPDRLARATVVARTTGVLAGLPLVSMVYAALDPSVRVAPRLRDGDPVRAGDVVAELSGPAAALLTGERTALNFLQHLAGIATLTSRFVAEVAGTRCRILDTRKTLPGYRALAKYAVRCGGGHNHRMGLYDRVMLKDNHWAAADGDIAALCARARRLQPDLPIEIEVDDMDQFERALGLAPDWILLDNFPARAASAAVARRNAAGSATLLEVSGNVTLDTVGDLARAGVDAASVGRLTHSAPALDLGLDFAAGDGPAPGAAP